MEIVLTTNYSVQLLSWPVKMLTIITNLVGSSPTSQKLAKNVIASHVVILLMLSRYVVIFI
jgi:hypothetical protein